MLAMLADRSLRCLCHSVLKVKIIQLQCHIYFLKNKQLSSGQNKRIQAYDGLMNMEQLLYLANVISGHYANIFLFPFMSFPVIAKAEPLQC